MATRKRTSTTMTTTMTATATAMMERPATAPLEPMERPTVTTKRKLLGGMRACDELLLAVALVSNAYHLSVQWMDENELDLLCAQLAPWLLPLLTNSHTGAHLALVLGDPLRHTVYLSRRVLRLLSMRSRHPVALTPLTRATTDALANTTTSALGPVARMAIYQADALLAVAARMAAEKAVYLAAQGQATQTAHGVRGGVLTLTDGYCYVVTAPRAVAEAAAQAASGVPCRVLAIPRAEPLPFFGALGALTPTATGDSGPLTL